MGQLTQKEVGGTGMNPLQMVDYKYNIRGWMTDINDVEDLSADLFGFALKYDQPTQGTPLYNGNISETYWKTSEDVQTQKYAYQYDGLNRLVHAQYSSPDSFEYNGNYNESLYYDKNGNIKELERNGYNASGAFSVMIDQLSYTYDSNNKNQLKKVVDLAQDVTVCFFKGSAELTKK